MHISEVSFNRPKLPPNATWHENGTTFVNDSTLNGPARGIFVNHEDTIFIAAHQRSQILVWLKESTAPLRILPAHLFEHTTLFVTVDGDIYFSSSEDEGRIDKWSMHSNTTTPVMKLPNRCCGLFIDLNNTLYCSNCFGHRVIKKALDDPLTTEMVVLGTNSSGNASNELSQPWGIFVDTNCNLYVADAGNDRIQLFRSGQLNATTVAGHGKPPGLTFRLPTDVVLDVDGDLYIADARNHRVIRSGLNEWECVIGCSGRGKGSAPNELHIAYSIRFDRGGNLYVADEFNNRIQKFTLATNSCGTCY